MTTHNRARTSTPILAATRPGFSLLELMGVLVILGLLTTVAAIAVPAQIEKARISTTKTSMSTIKSAVEAYRAENAGTTPASLADLIPSFLEQGAENDAWDQPFVFVVLQSGEHPYELISTGPDKQLRTADDINVWTMNQTTN